MEIKNLSQIQKNNKAVKTALLFFENKIKWNI